MPQFLIKNLLTRRRAVKLTQFEVASRIGVSLRAYQAWERREYLPSLRNLVKWGCALGMKLRFVVND